MIDGEKVCQLKCDCLKDCNTTTSECFNNPEGNCDKCGDGCDDGESCDGDYCVPSGTCTARKNQVSAGCSFRISIFGLLTHTQLHFLLVHVFSLQAQRITSIYLSTYLPINLLWIHPLVIFTAQLCNNAFFLVTGQVNNRAKCCPDSSGCVKDNLLLPENSVCSTTCGSCLGTIKRQDPLEPKVFCVFEDSVWRKTVGLKNCYDDITKPLCEEVIGSDPPFDVGEEVCKKNSPPVEGGSAGCEVDGSGEVIGPGLVCCETPHVTQGTCDVAGASFASYSSDMLSVLLLAQCRPEEVPL